MADQTCMFVCPQCEYTYSYGTHYACPQCGDRSAPTPKETMSIGHEDSSWPSPPENPQEMHGIDELHLVQPQRIVEAIRDYTITETWCAKNGERVMLRLEGKDLPPMTLNIDGAALMEDEFSTNPRPWIVALIDPVS